MGARANLIIVRDGRWELFYDHWCASLLDVELFWGPELAEAFIRQRGPTDKSADWLDEVWCEGGAVLDFDRKTLLWYGGESVLYDVLSRRAFAELMAYQWSGWRVEWAWEGIVSLARSVGVDPRPLLTRDINELVNTYLPIRPYVEASFPKTILLSIGACGAARVGGSEWALLAGQSQLDSLLAIPMSCTVNWGDSPIQSGLHIDLDSRALSMWTTRPQEALRERIACAWPDWTVHLLGDRFEDHLATIKIEVVWPAESKLDLQRSHLQRLRRLRNHEARNLASEFGKLHGHTRRFDWINPASDAFRSSISASETKLKILDALEFCLRSPPSHPPRL